VLLCNIVAGRRAQGRQALEQLEKQIKKKGELS